MPTMTFLLRRNVKIQATDKKTINGWALTIRCARHCGGLHEHEDNNGFYWHCGYFNARLEYRQFKPVRCDACIEEFGKDV